MNSFVILHNLLHELPQFFKLSKIKLAARASSNTTLEPVQNLVAGTRPVYASSMKATYPMYGTACQLASNPCTL